MFFNQLLNQAAPGGGALSGGAGGGLGSLASLIAMGAGNGGAGAAPVLPQPGAVPQSGPMNSPIPPVPQAPQSNLLQSLMQMDPQRLRQMLMGMGLGSYGFGNGAANMTNGSPGLISSLLASPDFTGPGTGGGGAY